MPEQHLMKLCWQPSDSACFLIEIKETLKQWENGLVLCCVLSQCLNALVNYFMDEISCLGLFAFHAIISAS